MKYLYSYVPFEHNYFLETYKFDEHFINLCKLSISQIKNYKNIIFYTIEELIPFFYENVSRNITYKKIDCHSNFFWAKSKYLSIVEEIKNDDEPLIHLDLDIVFNNKNIFNKEISDLCLSHGEPHNAKGEKVLFEKRIPSSYILDFYDLTFNFLKNENFPNDILKINIDYSYNTSIFGGKNIFLIKQICDKILNFENLYNQLFSNLIKKINISNQNQNTLLFGSVMEQSLMAYIIKNLNIEPEFYDINGKQNYLHFVGNKKNSNLFKQKLKYFCDNLLNNDVNIKEYFHGCY